MTTAAAVARLARLQPFERSGMRPGLERIEMLLDRLDHPEAALAVLHVGGTNGKGSVSALAEAILRAAGHRTGLYTSPHLRDLSERIRIAGAPIGPTALARQVERLGDALDGVTFFEAMTAVALGAFREAAVDVAVLEVGLGGRWDATNVGAPLVSVITRVDYDHQEYLGHRLEEIAAEKAAIIRGGVALSAAQAPEAMAVVEARCWALGVPLLVEGKDLRADVVRSDLHGHRLHIHHVAVPAASGLRDTAPFWHHVAVPAASGLRDTAPFWHHVAVPAASDLRDTAPFWHQVAAPAASGLRDTAPLWATPGWTLRDVDLALVGLFQPANATLAVGAVRVLAAAAGIAVPEAAIRAGCADVRWPGRFQVIPAGAGRPTLVLDGAHNGGGAAALAASLAHYFPRARLTLVLGISADKDRGGILKALVPLASRVVLTAAAHPRATPPAELAAALPPTDARVTVVADVPAALEAALTDPAAAVVCVAGSLFLVGEALGWLRAGEAGLRGARPDGINSEPPVVGGAGGERHEALPPQVVGGFDPRDA